MSRGVLEMVVSVAVVKGWTVLYRVSEPGSCMDEKMPISEDVVPIVDRSIHIRSGL